MLPSYLRCQYLLKVLLMGEDWLKLELALLFLGLYFFSVIAQFGCHTVTEDAIMQFVG